MAALEGISPSHKRESRPTLSLGWKRRPDVVHCGEQDHPNLIGPETHRNAWSVRQHQRGLNSSGRIRKSDADRALRAALKAALAGEVA